MLTKVIRRTWSFVMSLWLVRFILLLDVRTYRERIRILRASNEGIERTSKKLERESDALSENLAESEKRSLSRYNECRAAVREAASLRKDAAKLRRQRDVLYDNLLVNADTPMEVYVATNEIAQEGLVENQA